MQRGRATAVVGTLEGMQHAENTCANNNTTAVRTNFHVNTDLDRNGWLYGWRGANSSTGDSFLGVRMIISTAGGQTPQNNGRET
jgi:hypothetical protein